MGRSSSYLSGFKFFFGVMVWLYILMCLNWLCGVCIVGTCKMVNIDALMAILAGVCFGLVLWYGFTF